jgi:predicted dehydrogenase
VAVVGLGFMGKTHLAVYRQLVKKARIVAVCDGEESRLKEADPKGEFRHARSLDQVLADPSVDLVDICLPTYLHDQAALAALKAGKHVLCEKPVALDSAKASAVAAQANRSRGSFMTAQVLRFWPEYEVLRDFTRKGKLGKLKHLSLIRYSPKPSWTWKNWIVDPKKSGGSILDLHVHDVDFALHLCGKPSQIDARGVLGAEGGIDHADAAWSYPGGLRVSLSGGWGYPAGFPFRMGYTAKFERGTLDWDTSRQAKLTLYPLKGKASQPAVPVVGAGESKAGGNISNLGGYFVEIDYFLSCILAGRKPATVTPEEAALAVRAVEAEAASIRLSRPQTLA